MFSTARLGIPLLLAASLALLSSQPAHAQFHSNAVVGGVALDANGVIQNRSADPTNELALMRRRLKDAETSAPLRELKCISLPKIFAQARDLLAAHKPLPDDIQFLGGLTQVQYVFIYPDQHDLLLAGPSEDFIAADSLEPVGKITGRPVLQFFDLVVALRTLDHERGGKDFFGCSIDPPANAQQISDDIARQYSAKPRAQLTAAMAKAMGPQKVTIIGTPDNTRVAFTLVAADYKLKRFTMGLEKTPFTDLGNAVDDGRANGCRFWFEPSYEPLAVSPDGNAYALRGPRLQVKAGAQNFRTDGVTEKAKSFADLFTKRIPDLVKIEPALADLQNIADLSLVAALIRHDQLDKKIGWDCAWTLDAGACPVPVLPTPRSADTVVSVLGNAVASGGVAFSLNSVISKDARAVAKQGVLPAAPAPLAAADWQCPLALPPIAPSAPGAGAKP